MTATAVPPAVRVPPRLLPAVVGALVCAALAASALLLPVLLLPVLVLAALLLAVGWPRLLALPSPRGTSAVVAVAGLGAVGAVGVAGPPGTRVGAAPAALPLGPEGAAAAVLAALGLSVVLAFLHQILRTDGRPRLAESVAGTVTGAAAAALLAGWVGAAAPGGEHVAVGAAGVAAALLVTALPWPQRLTGVLGVAAAAAAAAVVAGLLPGVVAVPAAVVGAVLGLVVGGVDRLLTALPRATSRRLSGVVGLVAVALAAVPVQLWAVVAP